MRVCIRNSDNRIIESQSGSGDLDVLIQNAIRAGYAADAVTASTMDDAAFKTAMAAQAAADRQADPRVVRDKTFTDDADRNDLFSRLQTATPAQIKTYVQSTVTDLASAKLLLAKILLFIATK